MSILWEPSRERIEAANLTAFTAFVGERTGFHARDYADLHAWSVRERDAFWDAIWDYAGVIASHKGDRISVDGDRMPGARFFPDARLNFAENLMRRTGTGAALIFRNESGTERIYDFDKLHARVSRWAQALRAAGLQPGDRVAVCLPNIPDAIVAALAVMSIGGVWCSCSPDFGVAGILDRFRQIDPKILIVTDGYFYNGREVDVLHKMREVAAALPTVERAVIIPFLRDTAGRTPHTGNIPRARLAYEFIVPFHPAPVEFEQLPFSHPLYILFTSGTTGLPKCIVHGAGGTLLQHLKEHRLHFDIHADDRVFWFTTLGWMMWNWLISALASDACLMLYDGSPMHPDADTIFDFARDQRMTHLGTSARFIQAIEKAGVSPIKTHDLSALRVIGSTGSTLLPEGFDYIYAHVKKDVCLASASGGTDIVSCFVGGVPTLPVRRGEIQGKALGMAVEVRNEAGERVTGEKGELVCTRPFPSMPLGFWNDEDGSRYRAAYFEAFPGIWTHGDYAEETPEGGFLIYGRSDATLNPGGVRIGTAEIYRQVDQFDEILESVAVGQDHGGDVRVVLFVVPREGVELDDDLKDKLRRRIREGASPRHVPACIVPVTEIPRTRSGKITELAVRDVVHGRPVRNVEAIANPAALDQFRDRPELR